VSPRLRPTRRPRSAVAADERAVEVGLSHAQEESVGERRCVRDRLNAKVAALSHRGLPFRFASSVTSDVEERVPADGELTLIEAVGRARA
jgi:hypothetical protein